MEPARKITELDFDIDCGHMKRRDEIQIKTIDFSNRDQVFPLCLDYMKGFHLFSLLNVSDERLTEICEVKMDKACESGTCLSAELKDTGECIGIVFNEVMENQKSMGNYPFEELIPTHYLLDEIYDGFYEGLGVEKFNFGGPVYVVPGYQDWGIGREFAGICQYATAASDCEIFSAASANHYFTPTMKSLGFKVWKSVNLLEWRYPVTNEVVYRNAPKPHIKVESVWKRISPSLANNIPLRRTYMTSAASAARLTSNALNKNRKFAILGAFLGRLSSV